MVKVTYRTRMQELYQWHIKEDSGLARVTQRLKEDYPGEYTIVETFLPHTGYWGPKMIFEDEAEEIMFKLKYE